MTDQVFVIDSFAWFEYFSGSRAGETARTSIEGGNGITPTIVIAELAEKYARQKMHFVDDLKFIAIKSQIAPLDSNIAEKAGIINYERKRKVNRWGLADSIVLATARARKAKVITGDEHFRDLANEAIMIK